MADSEKANWIAIHDIKVPLGIFGLTPFFQDRLASGKYERGEVVALRGLIEPGDRVLDIGAGLGITSAAAFSAGAAHVTSVEANPRLVESIEKTVAFNGFLPDVRNLVLGQSLPEKVAFYPTARFWAASLTRKMDGQEQVMVPSQEFAELLAEIRPHLIICDIEGAEIDLFSQVDLKAVRNIVVETHPQSVGESATEKMIAGITAQGFSRVDTRNFRRIVIFDRNVKG